MTQIKVITGVERRRRFTSADKARILAETEEPGASVSGVAKKHDISPSLLYNWRAAARRQGDGVVAREIPAPFVRVIPEEQGEADQEPVVIRVHFDSEIVIDFPALIDPNRIAMVLAALRR